MIREEYRVELYGENEEKSGDTAVYQFERFEFVREKLVFIYLIYFDTGERFYSKSTIN